MPSPIAHLGSGYVIYRLYKQKIKEDRHRDWMVPVQLVLVAGLSMLPDLDVILAVIFGDMEKFHNNFSHSLFLGFPVALLCAGVFYWIYRSHFWTWFMVSLISYDLHIILDFFTGGRGVMLFWPWTQARFTSPVELFYGVQWGLGWFTIWHLWTIVTEGLFVLILLFGLNLLDKRRSRGIIAHSEEQ